MMKRTNNTSFQLADQKGSPHTPVHLCTSTQLYASEHIQMHARREREREREREHIKKKKEREGPRLRVTTVRKCAALTGSRLPNQAPAALHPSRQAGGDLSPPPLGMGTNKSGMKLTRGGMSSSSLKAPATGLVPASRVGNGALPSWGCRLPWSQSKLGRLAACGPPWPTPRPPGVGSGIPRKPGWRLPGGGQSSCRGPLGGATNPAAAPFRSRSRAGNSVGTDPGARPATRGYHPGPSTRR